MKNKSDLIAYTFGNNQKIEFKYINNDIFATVKSISELFGIDKSVITKHLKNIFESGELDENRCSASHAIHLPDGRVYQTKHYNLEAIVMVGFRSKSHLAKAFRAWTTDILREYSTKGHVINPNIGASQDAMDLLVNTTNDLRTDEKVIYRKMRDIIKLSTDYDEKSPLVTDFYKIVQNKIYYAATGMTSAEIKVSRADGSKDKMAMRRTKNPIKITKDEAGSAKGYLEDLELYVLIRISTIFIDSAELAILSNRQYSMDYWHKRIDKIILDNGFRLLDNAGKVTSKYAQEHIDREWQIYKDNLKLKGTKQTSNTLF